LYDLIIGSFQSVSKPKLIYILLSAVKRTRNCVFENYIIIETLTPELLVKFSTFHYQVRE